MIFSSERATAISFLSYPVIVANSIPIGMLSLLLIEDVGNVIAGKLAAEATSTFFAENMN